MSVVFWQPGSVSSGQVVIEFRGGGTASILDPAPLLRKEPVLLHHLYDLGEMAGLHGLGNRPCARRGMADGFLLPSSTQLWAVMLAAMAFVAAETPRGEHPADAVYAASVRPLNTMGMLALCGYQIRGQRAPDSTT